MKKNSIEKAPETPSTAEVQGNPQNVFEQINKFGTYNIQPTADTDNDYPAIAQGCPKAVIEREQAARPKHPSGNDPDPGHPYPPNGKDPIQKKLFKN